MHGLEVTAYIAGLSETSIYCINLENNLRKFYVLPTQCIYVFCVDVGPNSDYFPIEH